MTSLPPNNPTFYVRYVNNSYIRRNKGVPDKLFTALNKYHKNMTFTIEENPEHFLDTNITTKNGIIETSVHIKNNKFPVFWSSKVPKRYKRNAINGELHRASKISSNFENEIRRIKKKFKNVGFPTKFTESVIRDFQKIPEEEIENLIPDWLFDERRDFYVKIPFCPSNEETSKGFLRKLDEYTCYKYKFKINWNTRNIRSLFPLKDRVEHISCAIYEGICSCGNNYIGETNRNVEVRWKEHNTPSTNHNQNSEPSKHLEKHPAHQFLWQDITSASRNHSRRKILESYFIAKFKPTLNDQKTPKTLLLFKNGIT